MPFYDYRALPVGTVLETGVIQICPHCGKAGLKETEPQSGMDFYTHEMVARWDGKNNPDIRWDMCPKPQART